MNRSIEENKEKKYEVTCPYCCKVQYTNKDLLHKLGHEAAYRHCKDCDKIIKLIYDSHNDSMTAEKKEHKEIYEIICIHEKDNTFRIETKGTLREIKARNAFLNKASTIEELIKIANSYDEHKYYYRKIEK